MSPRKRGKTFHDKECRACLANISDTSFCVDIFRTWRNPMSPGLDVTIAQDLAKLANVEISFSDLYSKVICKKCCNRLQDALNFIRSVQNSDSALRSRKYDCDDETPLWPKPIQVDKNTSSALNEMTVEVKQEVLSEDEYDMMENNEVNELDIKIEPEEITPVPPPNSTPFEAEDKYSLPMLLEPAVTLNGETEFLKEHELEGIKEEPMSEEELEPETDMPKDCMLCMKTFNTVKGLKAHVIALHSYKSVTSLQVDKGHVCITCNEGFATRTDLFVHETSHSNYVCYVCDEKFETFSLLTQHRNKQCKKTTVLPRLKTLEDVKRPSAVYYIVDKKQSLSASPPKNENTSQSLIKPTSLTDVKKRNLSSGEANSVSEQTELKINRIKLDAQPLKSLGDRQNSVNDHNARVEYLLSEWDDMPEAEKSENGETKDIKDTTNSPTSNPLKISSITGKYLKPNTINGSDVFSKENTLKIQESDMIRTNVDYSESCDMHSIDTSQTHEGGKRNEGNNPTYESYFEVSENKVDDKINKIPFEENNKSERKSKVCDKIIISTPKVYNKRKQNESEVSDKKEKTSEVIKKTKRNESEVGSILEKTSDVNKTKEKEQTKETNSEVSDREEENPKVSNKAYENIEEALTFETNAHNIKLKPSGDCSDDKGKEIQTTENLENTSTEIIMKNLEPQCPTEDSMKIQLEIHAVDKDNTMEADIDLKSELKSLSGDKSSEL